MSFIIVFFHIDSFYPKIVGNVICFKLLLIISSFMAMHICCALDNNQITSVFGDMIGAYGCCLS